MKEVGNRGIGRKRVSGLMAQRQWRMITRGLLGQAAGMRQRKRRDVVRGKADWITDFESGTLFVMMRSKVWLWEWTVQVKEMTGEEMRESGNKGKANVPCLHGFIMRSTAGLHFKRIVHRCLRKTFLSKRFFFFFLTFINFKWSRERIYDYMFPR